MITINNRNERKRQWKEERKRFFLDRFLEEIQRFQSFAPL